MSSEHLIFIHGIWSSRASFVQLAARVRKYGYKVHYFDYRSVTRSPEENAAKLNEFIESIDADKIHLVAHSLGGLVLKHFMHNYSQPSIDKVIMLATPINGSDIAKTLNQHDASRLVLGRAVEKALLGGAPAWPKGRPLAMVAGNKGVGIGNVILGLKDETFSELSDGVVRLEETMSDEVTHHCVIQESHTMMLFSKSVAKAVLHYLEHSNFDGLRQKQRVA